jgi:hypothetical protein
MDDRVVVTPAVLHLLRRTRRWSVLTGIACLLVGVVWILATIMVVLGGSTEAGPVGIATMGALGLVGGLTSLALSYAAIRYSFSVGQFLDHSAAGHLEQTLAALLGFWRVSGGVALVFVTTLALLIGAAALVGSAEYPGPFYPR